MDYTFTPIGVVRTPFREKFGIPRQPGLVSEARGQIVMPFSDRMQRAVQGLEEFSHLWIVFVFHANESKDPEGWKPSIRPPRLGGKSKMGVLASRSPHRPNPIGMSVVRLESLRIDKKSIVIEVSGVDLLDETPVLDLKPYLAYADSIPDAQSGWASEPIEKKEVRYTLEAESRLRAIESEAAGYTKLVEGVLALDPRPAFQKRKGNSGDYGMMIQDWDVRYRFDDDTSITVTAFLPAKSLKNAKKASPHA